MLKIKTYIDKSSIHGIGLFAKEFIPKGTVIWELKKGFDVLFTKEQYLELPIITQEYITHHSYFDTEINCHVLCSDNARFFNKSERPNCGGQNGSLLGNTIALRDINANEELTEIYFNLSELEKLKKSNNGE